MIFTIQRVGNVDLDWTYVYHKHFLKYDSRRIWILATRRDSLTRRGRVTHIWVSKLTIIGSDNGLPPGRRQAIIRNNTGILLIGPIGTNLCEILIEIHTFSFKKIHLKISSGKWRPFCLGGDEFIRGLMQQHDDVMTKGPVIRSLIFICCKSKQILKKQWSCPWFETPRWWSWDVTVMDKTIRIPFMES